MASLAAVSPAAEAAAAAASMSLPSVAPASTSAFGHQIGSAATCLACGVIGHRTERCVAHLMPNVVLAAPTGKKHRLEHHCERWRKEADESAAASAAAAATTDAPVPAAASASSSPSSAEWSGGVGLEVLPSQREAELVFLRSPTPSHLARCIQRSPVLDRHFDNLFVVPWVEHSLEGVAARVQRFCVEQTPAGDAAASSATTADTSSIILRVQSYPKSLRQEVLDAVSPSVRMHPRDYTHVLCVVRAYNKFFVGIEERDLLDSQPEANPHNKDDILSRAYHKLSESFLVDRGLNTRIKAGHRAIDIGASPGGWSAYLASRGCHVLAIDPGVVNCSSPLVQHVPKLIQNSLDEVRAFTAESPLDLIVCDMNVRPSVAVDLIHLVCEAAAMSPTAMIVFTTKETLVGRSKMLMEEAMVGLTDFFGEYRSFHLLANGRERTLIGEFRHLTPEQREQVRAERAVEQQARLAEWERTLAERKAREASQEAAGIVSKRKKRDAKKASGVGESV